MTTAQLRARLRRLVVAADPDAAAKQAVRDSADRRVQAFLNDNNLAALAGYELAPHRVAAAMERLDAIAKAAKASGDDRGMGQLRADAFLDLLAGAGIAAGGPITDGAITIAEDVVSGGAPRLVGRVGECHRRCGRRRCRVPVAGWWSCRFR